MADSRQLRLFQACRRFQHRLTAVLVARLQARGYTHLTASHLAFLAQLECGENHASEIARQTGISRQAVHKQVKELAALGLLDERADAGRGNRRPIVFTERGIQLIADCRAILAELDATLPATTGDVTAEDAMALLGEAAARLIPEQ